MMMSSTCSLTLSELNRIGVVAREEKVGQKAGREEGIKREGGGDRVVNYSVQYGPREGEVPEKPGVQPGEGDGKGGRGKGGGREGPETVGRKMKRAKRRSGGK